MMTASITTPLPDYTLARSILGADFITPEEVAKARPSIVYTEDQLIELGKKLPDQATLEAIRGAGMFLTATPSTAMSLLEVRAVYADYFYSKGPEQDDSGWYDEANEKFARTDKVEALTWIAFRKEPVEDSLNKTWSEQAALVAPSMMVPNAAEATWALTTYKAVRDGDLLDDLYVSTSSLDSDGDRVDVGLFDAGGLLVRYWHDDSRRGNLGVSSGRKF